MESSSLQNSESIKSLSQDFHQTQVLNQYLTNRFDWFATTVIDYMDEKDPQKRYAKITAARFKETQDLRKYNKDLQQKVKDLQNKIFDLQSEINKIKSPNPIQGHNGQNGSPNSEQIENSSNPTAHLGYQKLAPSLQILPEQQRNALQQIDSMNEHMKEQKREEQQQLLALGHLFENMCEKLTRIAKIQKVTERDLLNEQTLTVTMSKQKYDLLIDFYCRGSYLQIAQGDSEKDQVGQFSAQEITAPKELTNQTEILSIEELQKMFEALAQNNGKSREWKNYLLSRQNQNEKQLANLKEIASAQVSKQDQAKLRELKEFSRQDKSSSLNSSNLDTTVSLTNYLNKEVEDKLFLKIKQLMKELNFSQTEYDLFIVFDEKRKCDRLYDVDEFLKKFKNKTDLHEISEAYTVYLVKTLNFMLINVMELLSGLKQQNLGWFKDKLTKRSELAKEKLFQKIEEQFSIYMEEKHKSKGEEKGKKRPLKEISETKFDKQKHLEKELAQTVYQYRDILKSSIFNQHSRINLK